MLIIFKNIVKNDKTVYGINTGFGILANKKISEDDLNEDTYNEKFIMTNSCYLPIELIKHANNIINRKETINKLEELINDTFRENDIEYKCPMCPTKICTQKSEITRLPRVLILHLKWFEFDIGWFWVKVFELFGLVKINGALE